MESTRSAEGDDASSVATRLEKTAAVSAASSIAGGV